MHSFTRLVSCACLAAVVLTPAAASAQNVNPVDQPRFTIGPLGLAPAVAIRDAGVDTNVFNSDSNPVQDYTATLTGSLDVGLRVRNLKLRTHGQFDYVTFATVRHENSLNGSGSIRLDLPLGRVTPFASYSALNSRHRVGFEIDARARRIEDTTRAGLDVRVGGKTSVNAAVQRARVRFDGGAFFAGTSLREVLDRNEESATLAIRYAATPLTTVLVQSDARRDRFLLMPIRDANSVRIASGLEFSPRAGVTGSLVVGVRTFEPLNAILPTYRGVVANVDLTSRIGSRLSVRMDGRRDIGYSYEPTLPFYVEEGGLLTASVDLFGPWDVAARGGRYRLAYLKGFSTPRTELTDIGGAGIGLRLRRASRIGIDADYYRRTSDLSRRSYSGLRISTSLNHVF